MDTKLATTQVRLQQWAAIVRERKESGLKVDDYCEAHNISRNAYYYWLRKLREAALESQNSRFVELPVPAAGHAGEKHPVLTISLRDAVIHVDETVSRELLAMTVEVLRNAE